MQANIFIWFYLQRFCRGEWKDSPLKEIQASEEKGLLPKTSDLESRKENWVLAHFIYALAVWSQANHSSSLSLSLLIYEKGNWALGDHCQGLFRFQHTISSWEVIAMSHLSSLGHSVLGQQFSNSRVHQNHLQSMFRLRLLGPTPRTQYIWGEGPEFTFLVSSQAMLMLLIQGPHLENQLFRTLRLFNEIEMNLNTYLG